LLQQIESLSDSQRSEIADRIQNIASSESGFRTDLAEAISHDVQNGQASAYSRALGVSDSEEFRQARQDVNTSTRSFNELSALRTSIGINQSVPITAFGKSSSDDASLRELTGLAHKHGVNMEEVNNDVGVWTQAGFIYDREQAYAASVGSHLTHGDADARVDLARFMSERGFGNASPELDQPDNGLDGVRPVYGEVTSAVSSEVSEVPFTAAGATSRIDSNISPFGSNTTQAQEAVNKFFEANKAGNMARREEALREIDEIVNNNRANHAEATFKDDRGILEAIGDTDITGGLRLGTEQLGTSIGYAAAAYGAARQEALDAGHSEFSAQLAGLGAAGKGWTEGFNEIVTREYDGYYNAAIEAGLPDVAAQYYADQGIKYTQSIDQYFSRMFGLDAAYEAREQEVTSILGERSVEMLDRAARTEGDKGLVILEGAGAIYQRDNR
jgi:hypothetical protein